MAALQGYGISTSLAVRIYKKFGDRSGAVITEEPYRLAREVWGIGFKIARAVGIASDEGHTLLAGVGPERPRGDPPGGGPGGDRRGHRGPPGERRRGGGHR